MTLAPIEYVAAASEEAQRRFPALDHDRSLRTLTVVRGDGAVYEGEPAWLVCGWLLPNWQSAAEFASTRHRLLLVGALASMADLIRHRARHGGRCESADRCLIAAPSAVAGGNGSEDNAVRSPWARPAHHG